MEAKHTPEPWETSALAYGGDPGRTDPEWTVCSDGGGDMIADLTGTADAEANAARIVACVNALAGLNPAAVALAIEALRFVEADAVLTMAEAREIAAEALAALRGGK